MKYFKNVFVQTGFFAGVASGIVTIVLFLLFRYTGSGIFDGIFTVDFFITFPFIVACLYYIRKRRDELRIWQSIVLGAVTVFTSLAFYMIFVLVFTEFIDPNYFAESILLKLKELKEIEVAMSSSEEYKEEFANKYPEMKAMIKSLSIGSLLVGKLIFHTIAGTIYTLFMAILFRK